MDTTLKFIPGQLSDSDDQELHQFLREISSEVDWAGLRYVQEITQWRGTRDERPDINSLSLEKGVCLEILYKGQLTYAATSDLSKEGLRYAFRMAQENARSINDHGVYRFCPQHRPAIQGHYQSPIKKPLDQTSLAELTDHLMQANRKLRCSPLVINSLALALVIDCQMKQYSTNGTHIDQSFLLFGQNFSATAQNKGVTHSRTMNGYLSRCYQMGTEALNPETTFAQCERIGQEAVELLTADECPTDHRDLLLAPDQMTLQIHESIGHPLELDRILGDERNFAGWSFVKPADFGFLQYGSPLMNVSFDPFQKSEFAAYGFDDCGQPAQREYLIRNGRLERGLGSIDSQLRSHLPGVANFRASSWNRAPIDRMANINLEPGNKTLAELIAMTEKGIYMQANRSWSIDDYRNKFQFGCEYAQLIENGKLTKVVKNPNYRGSTIKFWNSLKALGNSSEVESYGNPYCGKGEPSQIIRYGHSSPPCLFENVNVFGGGQ